MTLEIFATWGALLLSVGGIVYQMGKQSQKITHLEQKDIELELKLQEHKSVPVELAIVKTTLDMVLRELQDMKRLLSKEKE